jgi:hypothetical protein
MQGRKDLQPKMMYQVSLNTLVPADNFYSKLAQTARFALSLQSHFEVL